MSRRAWTVVALVVGALVFVSGAARWMAATGDVDDEQQAVDEEAREVAELGAEVEALQALDADTRALGETIFDDVRDVAARSAAHLQAAQRLLDARSDYLAGLATAGPAEFDQLVGRLEPTDDAVHETQIALFAVLDPLNAALLDIEAASADALGGPATED